MLAKRLRVYLFLIKFRIVRTLILRIPPKLKERARRFLLQRVPNSTGAPQHESQATWIQRHYENQCISKSFKGEEVKFSIILPVYKVEVKVFKELLESLKAQTYKNFEVCIAAHGTTPKIENEILNWSNSNQLEIKFEFSCTNDGISSTSNRALEMASGDFCVLLDHDDFLPPHAIRLIADGIEKNKDVTLLYTDKETISEKGATINVLLKPTWSPEMMLSANYLTHLNAIRTSFLREIGGWDSRTDGAQDWDIFLRIAASKGKIVNVPGVAYSWRQVSTSVAAGGLSAKPYAKKAQEVAIQRYLDIKFPGSSVTINDLGAPVISWKTHLFTLIEFDSESDLLDTQDFENLRKVTGVNFVLFVDRRIKTVNLEKLAELTGPLVNSDISAVGPIFVNSENMIVDGARIKLSDGTTRPLFARVYMEGSSILGSHDWIRNASALSPLLFAVRIDDVIQSNLQNIGVESALETLSNLGRFVTLPSVRVLSEVTPLDKISDAVHADPYYSDLISFDLNGPVLKHTSRPKTPIETFSLQSSYFLNHLPRISERNFKTNHDQATNAITKMAWILPGFNSSAYGGIRTILRFAEHLQLEKNIAPTFFVNGLFDSNKLKEDLSGNFPSLVNVNFTQYIPTRPLDLSDFQIGVATLWTTAYDLNIAKGNLRRLYLVQDYEPDFYPAGTMKLLSFESYRLGLEMISNTKGLQIAMSKHGLKSNYFSPGMDFDIFNAMGCVRVDTDPVKIFFYMRPSHLRNCFEINLELIRKLKKRFGSSIEIICAGADFNLDEYGLRDLVTYVGMVPYAQNGEMYKGIDIGVSLMASSHPSYPPLEMMACGVAVVTNYNPETEWIFNTEVCEYVPGTLDSLYQAIERLVTDPDYRNEMGLKASKYIQASMPTWEDSCKNFVSAIGLE